MITKESAVEKQKIAVLPKQQDLFDFSQFKTTPSEVKKPGGYKGLAAFHKYWGKKPVECLSYLIESLTKPGEIVVDPFLGTGLIARECLRNRRRFIGVDINPFSKEMATLLIDLPSYLEFARAVQELSDQIKPSIDESYRLENKQIATHYLWEEDRLVSVWATKGNKRAPRVELEPTVYDHKLCEKYFNYTAHHIRPLNLFDNTRINTNKSLSLNDLFTGRALKNIDLILDYIHCQPERLRRALLLTLTSASGQMSNMVFAITNRGKNSGAKNDRIEVGSWVIGYWRPKLHFEINVWNCFSNKANRLLKVLLETDSLKHGIIQGPPGRVVSSEANISLSNDDCRKIIKELPDESVSLILTDPPHSDRIPYLELSELWNAILKKEPCYKDEIVVSNAKDRGKDSEGYYKEMHNLLKDFARVLKPCGFIAIMFNARDKESWSFFSNFISNPGPVKYEGYFPMEYSATSVVQDNREGGLKNDYVLIFSKPSDKTNPTDIYLNSLDGWSTGFPIKQGD